MLYCLLKATHKEITVLIGAQRITLQPGQFIFGRLIAAKETGLTERQIRTCLELLKNLEFLTIKTTNKFSIITIVNWHIYQMSENENDQQNDQLATSNMPHTNTKEGFLYKKPPEEILENISILIQRYPDQALITEGLKAIASTRKGKRIAETLKLKILESWTRFTVEKVQGGVRAYLEKGYAEQGKNEKYLLGIVRNFQQPEKKENPAPEPSAGSSIVSCPRCGERILRDDLLPDGRGCHACARSSASEARA